MRLDFESFKNSVDSFFTLPTFDKKPPQEGAMSSTKGTDKSYKIAEYLTKENGINAAKVVSFVLFFPLGIGALVNTARKWNEATNTPSEGLSNKISKNFDQKNSISQTITDLGAQALVKDKTSESEKDTWVSLSIESHNPQQKTPEKSSSSSSSSITKSTEEYSDPEKENARLKQTRLDQRQKPSTGTPANSKSRTEENTPTGKADTSGEASESMEEIDLKEPLK